MKATKVPKRLKLQTILSKKEQTKSCNFTIRQSLQFKNCKKLAFIMLLFSLKNEKARLAQKAQTENESIQCDILMTSKEMWDKSVQATINAKLNRVRSACVKYRNTKSSLLRVSQSQKKLAGNLFWPTKSRLSVAITTDTSKLVGNHKSFNI